MVATKTSGPVAVSGTNISTFWRRVFDKVLLGYTPVHVKFWTTYLSASEPFRRLCTWRFKYSKVNLDWCRRISHLSIYCVSLEVRYVPHSIPDHMLAALILVGLDGYFWLSFYRNAIKLGIACILGACLLCLLFILEVLWTKLTIVYRSSPVIELFIILVF